MRICCPWCGHPVTVRPAWHRTAVTDRTGHRIVRLTIATETHRCPVEESHE